MTEEEKQLVFQRLCQMQEQIDDIKETQDGLIKRLQNMFFDTISLSRSNVDGPGGETTKGEKP